jgi:hypothetical protein
MPTSNCVLGRRDQGNDEISKNDANGKFDEGHAATRVSLSTGFGELT